MAMPCYSPSGQMKTLIGRWSLLVSGILGGAVLADAAPIRYDISFTASTGVAPTSSSFVYDASTSTFTDFIVTWHGITFNLTIAANNPVAIGLCDTAPPGMTGIDAFAFLSNPTCGAGDSASGWRANNVSAVFVFVRDNRSGTDRILVVGGGGVSPEPLTFAAGDFSIAPVPEPSTAGVLVAAGLMWAWRQRRAK